MSILHVGDSERDLMAVATLIVEPKRVLGTATGRGESEVIIDPRRFDWKSVAVEVTEE